MNMIYFQKDSMMLKFRMLLVAAICLIVPASGFSQSCATTETKVSYTYPELTGKAQKSVTIIPPFTSLQQVKKLNKATLNVLFNSGRDHNYGVNAFNSKVIFTVKAYRVCSAPSEADLISTYKDTLEINEASPEQLSVKDYTANPDIRRIDIIIDRYNFTSTGGPAFTPLAIDTLMQVSFEEDHGWDVRGNTMAAPGDPTLTVPSYLPVTVSSVNASANPIVFTWSNSGYTFPNYEFQLLRLYNTSTSTSETSITASIDWNKALTIETQSSATSLALTITEGTGYYIWRVRPVGTYYDGGIANSQNWGEWSSTGSYTQGSTINVNSAPSPFGFFYSQFEADRNWIYSRTFTEGNRISEQIVYANGLQQVKQTQAHLQSEDKVLVSQTVQDLSGRPALSTMGAPVDINHPTDKNLEYKEKFIKNSSNQLYRAEDFDENSNYENPSPVADGPLQDYYSNENTNVNIPSAEGYPYTRTLYHRDGTNRVKEQGGAGAVHRIGSTASGDTRTIRTLYSGVADAELIRVFGDEAPKDTTVNKVINIDANKTASVTYISKEGQTIATCLAVNGDNPLLDTLKSRGNAGFDIIDTITGYTGIGSTRLVSSKTYAFVEETNLELDYSITPNDLTEGCSNVCETCDYKIYFTIFRTDDPDDINFPQKDSLIIDAGACPSAAYTFNKAYLLPAGSYLVQKTIRTQNIDPASGGDSTYLEGRKKALQAHLNAEITAALGPVFTYLDDGNMEGLYAHLGVPADVDTGKVSFSAGCFSVDIPVRKCTQYDCPAGGPDFEAYFYAAWPDDKVGVTNFAGTVYPRGKFNELVYNMLNDASAPYTCEELWKCWEVMVQTYGMVSSAMTAAGKTFDLVDQFLKCTGKRPRVFSPDAYGNPGYLSHAYYCLNDNSQYKLECIELLRGTYGGDISSWSLEAWTGYEGCLNGITGIATNTNILDMHEGVEDSCKAVCDWRYMGFRQSIIREYLEAEYDLVASGADTTLVKSGMPVINESDINCMAQSLVDNCKHGCDLTVFYNPLEPWRIDSVGSQAEIENVRKSMTYAYEVQLPGSGSCNAGFDQVQAWNLTGEATDTSLGVLWTKVYGGSGSDQSWWGGGLPRLSTGKIMCSHDDCFLIGGTSDSPVGGDKSEGSIDYDFWVIKTDKDGNKKWDRTFNKGGRDILTVIEETSDGGHILGGYTNAAYTDASPYAEAYWVVKIDKDGNVQWDKVYAVAERNYLYGIKQAVDGGYIVAGYTEGLYVGNDYESTMVSSPKGNKDFWVIKTDVNGNPQWQAFYGGSGEDYLTDMVANNDGYTFAGYSWSPFSGDKTASSNGSNDYWMIKIDLVGNKLWDRTYGGSNSDYLNELTQTADGGYLLGGASNSSIDGNKTAPQIGGDDFWIIKTDNAGNKQWERTFGGEADDWCLAAEETHDGGFIMAGWSGMGYTNDPLNCDESSEERWNNQYYIIKADASGEMEWEKQYEGLGDMANMDMSPNYATSVSEVGDNEYIVLGMIGRPVEGVVEDMLSNLFLVKIGKQDVRPCSGKGEDMVNTLNITLDNFMDYIGHRDTLEIPISGIDGCNMKMIIRIGLVGVTDGVNRCNERSSYVSREGDGTYPDEYYTYCNISSDYMSTAVIDGVYHTIAGFELYKNNQLVLEWRQEEISAERGDPNKYLLQNVEQYGGFRKVFGEFFQDASGQLRFVRRAIAPEAGDQDDTGITNNCHVVGIYRLPDIINPADNTWFNALDGCCDRQTCLPVCFRWVSPVIPVDDNTFVFEPKPCGEVMANYVRNYIDQQVGKAKDDLLAALEEDYKSTCADPGAIRDVFTTKQRLGYHHYTLYYYDRAGNLIKTVPPAGVSLNHTSRLQHPQHAMVTEYEYNSLKQLVRQKTPDGGEIFFWYDLKGQLRFSQNAQQKLDGKYSYTKYDALGRIVEVGQSSEEITMNYFATKANDRSFPASGSERTHTMYTVSSAVPYLDGRPQRYLQNRVSYTYTDEGAATYYSYDVHGNVEWLVQQVPQLGLNYIAYEYDLVSGNVLKVRYNEGKNDQFYHRYSYDADNRITQVETSKDNYIWDRDARYNYYAHGPLKKITTGEDKVQGTDYTYTLHGWLKGVNTPVLAQALDPGQDGLGNNTATDAFGMTLGYYNGDFSHTGSTFNSTDAAALNGTPLYNGNISAWTSNHQKQDNTVMGLTGETFKYDELNRITASSFNRHTGAWAVSDDYQTKYRYDGNGNLDTLVRKGYGKSAADRSMDNLIYHYTAGTNKLTHVSDIGDNTDAARYDDIKAGQQANNYTYDAIGNMTADVQEGITSIKWTVYGKIQEVSKSNGEKIAFKYDAQGNRIMKDVSFTGGVGNVTTYYVRDASGNIMAVYDKKKIKDNPVITAYSYTLKEMPLYGSDRVGVYVPLDVVVKTECIGSGCDGGPEKPSGEGTVQQGGQTSGSTDTQSGTTSTDTQSGTTSTDTELGSDQVKIEPGPDEETEIREVPAVTYTRSLGWKQYELKDHLGNVRVTLSDIKHSTITGGIPSAFTADIRSYNNYYAFGMLMPGRTYNVPEYRYGFNGKEMDNEVAGTGNQYDYGFRIYNPRLGKFLSVDPLTSSFPWYTPYQFAGNKPIVAIDLDGLEEKPATIKNNNSNKPQQKAPDQYLIAKYMEKAWKVIVKGVTDADGWDGNDWAFPDQEAPGFEWQMKDGSSGPGQKFFWGYLGVLSGAGSFAIGGTAFTVGNIYSLASTALDANELFADKDGETPLQKVFVHDKKSDKIYLVVTTIIGAPTKGDAKDAVQIFEVAAKKSDKGLIYLIGVAEDSKGTYDNIKEAAKKGYLGNSPVNTKWMPSAAPVDAVDDNVQQIIPANSKVKSVSEKGNKLKPAGP